ncbi:MAG: hypothetical protein IH812_01660 [Proteobacteria bacterium]|nr:hypothetical protein [Pseudomonadota bacterium]
MSMSKNYSQTDSPVAILTNEAARKRWELFHLAIAHAKKFNAMAMQEAETSTAEPKRTGPLLSVAG